MSLISIPSFTLALPPSLPPSLPPLASVLRSVVRGFAIDHPRRFQAVRGREGVWRKEERAYRKTRAYATPRRRLVETRRIQSRSVHGSNRAVPLLYVFYQSSYVLPPSVFSKGIFKVNEFYYPVCDFRTTVVIVIAVVIPTTIEKEWILKK